MKVMIPECIWELHKEDFDWLCESIEKGLYSVDVGRLLTLLREGCLLFKEPIKYKEINMENCQFSILLTCREELLKIALEFNLGDEELTYLVSYLAIYGFLMGEV